MTAPKPDRQLTPTQVAEIFGVDPKTVTRWAKTGRLESTRTLGGHRRCSEATVRAALDATRRGRKS